MEDVVSSSPSPGMLLCPTQRLIVVKMVLHHFKSYGHVESLGPFHKRFTAVVGPNGSGKSNFIDGLMFVFGKKAKKLRMKSAGELVHNSSENPNVMEAKVEIFFAVIDDADEETKSETTDAYKVVAGSEFTLARTAKKDGSTAYYLDGKKRTFEDVTDFMMARGVDVANNRFLILQGEVEQISTMKPKAESKNEEGFLEYLEDLIGTAQYVEKIEESQKLVDELATSRATCLDRVKQEEQELSQLEAPKGEAVKLRSVEMSINEVKCALFGKRAAECAGTVHKIESTHADLDMDIKNAKDAVKNAKALETEKVAEFMDKNEAHGAILKELEKAEKETQGIMQESIQRESEVAKQTSRQEKAAAAKEKARETETIESLKIRELEEVLPKFEADVATKQTVLEAAQAESEKTLQEFHTEADAIRVKLEQKRLEFAPVAGAFQAAESETRLLETELDLALRASKDAATKLHVAQTEQTAFTKTAAELPKCIQEGKEKIQTLQKIVHEIQATRVVLKAKESESESQLNSIQGRLEIAKSTEQSKAARGSLSQALRQAQAKGGALEKCGFVGRLGDLGSVPEEYETAATVAAGNNLDSFVVRSVTDATQCVDYLRAKNLGVATFLILEKLAAPPNKGKAGSFPCPRVFDLIEMNDPLNAPAFYYAVRDTLVAKTLDQAEEVAFEGKGNKICMWRVVTSNGDLIEKAGTFSGGGNANAKKRSGFAGGTATASAASSDVVEDDLVELEKTRDALAKELDTLRRGPLHEAEAKLSKALKELSKLESSVLDMEMELDSVSQRLEMAKTRCQELELASAISDADRARIDQMETELSIKRELRDGAKSKSDAIESQVTKLTDTLSKVGGDVAKTRKAKVDVAQKSLDKARENLTKSQVAMESSKRALEMAQRDVDLAGGEFEKALASHTKSKQKLQKLEEVAGEVWARLEEAKKAEQERRAELVAIKSVCSSLKDDCNKLEKEVVNKQVQLNKVFNDLEKATERLSKWNFDFEQSKKNLAEAKTQEKQEKEEEDALLSGDVDDDEDEDEDEQRTKEEEAAKAEAAHEALLAGDERRLESDLHRLEAEAKGLRGNVNMSAIREYKQREKDYQARVKELNKATAVRDAARKELDDLKRKRLEEFTAGFVVIKHALKEIYQQITFGGDAELEPVDSNDPFSEGIVFSVRPPKKSWKNISNLSGGEKTLSSLSFVFALHKFRPAPIYVMDEIDAALDFKNVSIVANFVKERTKNAQFLIISLRNNMFELADRLVGVYKTQNSTKSVTINPNSVAIKSGLAAAAAVTRTTLAGAGAENNENNGGVNS